MIWMNPNEAGKVADGKGHDGAEMTKIKKRTWFIAGGLFAALFVAAVLVIGVRQTPEKTMLKVMSDRVDLQVKDVRFTDVASSGMTWEVTADTARYLKNENLALLEQVKIRLVMKDGRVFVMKGDRGQFNTKSRDMNIEGKVSIVSEKGERFTTDRLQYLDAGKRIETDGPVVMENQSARISGVGMVLSLDEKKVSLLSNVRASSWGN